MTVPRPASEHAREALRLREALTEAHEVIHAEGYDDLTDKLRSLAVIVGHGLEGFGDEGATYHRLKVDNKPVQVVEAPELETRGECGAGFDGAVIRLRQIADGEALLHEFLHAVIQTAEASPLGREDEEWLVRRLTRELWGNGWRPALTIPSSEPAGDPE